MAGAAEGIGVGAEVVEGAGSAVRAWAAAVVGETEGVTAEVEVRRLTGEAVAAAEAGAVAVAGDGGGGLPRRKGPGRSGAGDDPR